MDLSLPEPVARALSAANANETEAFLAAFIDDGVVDDWGREFVGPAEIRSWSDREFIGKRVMLEILSAEQRGDGFNGPSHFTFLVDGGRLARMTIRQ
jgi:hypothetical protein